MRDGQIPALAGSTPTTCSPTGSLSTVCAFWNPTGNGKQPAEGRLGYRDLARFAVMIRVSMKPSPARLKRRPCVGSMH